MWNHCQKLLSIYRCSKGIPILRSSLPYALTYRYLPKAYFGDYTLCSKEKKKSDLLEVKCISEHFIKPKYEVEQSKQPYHLSPFDIAFISVHYINIGLLFTKPSYLNNAEFSFNTFLKNLKESLSLTLVHFYPLAGQLVSEVDEEKHESYVYVDCNKGPGVRFIHATLDTTIYNIITPNYVPSIVRSFFDPKDEVVVNYDGHTKPLLSIQITELVDGFFIACSANHCIVDGTSYWQFWNIWSKIHRGLEYQNCESHMPVFSRWHYDGCTPGPCAIPFTHPNEFVRKFETPEIKSRIFHFSSKSIARLKAKANEEKNISKNISSLQALSALVWRSIVRANSLHHDQITYNYLFANNRERLDPPLPRYYFGNFVQPLAISATAGELLGNNLGWAATLLHEAVVNHTDKSVRSTISEWFQSSYRYYHEELHGPKSITIENSPRSDMYGNDFGLGKPITFGIGYGNKAEGVIFACQGNKGEGSVDLDISLSPNAMDALESSEEFMAFVD